MTALLSLLALALNAETHVYKQARGLPIEADLHRAPSQGPHPVLLWIHGGALIMGSRRNLEEGRKPHLDRYLSEGWTVVSIDYRLAPETRLPEIWKDVRDAYAWIRTQGPKLFAADPSRIAIVGGSAGGYLSLLAAAKLQPKPKAVVSFYGYGDIAGDWYAKPDAFYRRQPEVAKEQAWASVGTQPIADPPAPNQRGRFYLFTRQQGTWPELVAGGKNLSEYCPEKLVKPGYPPTMLLHGDADTDVPVEQSKQMAAALERAGIVHQLIILPGAPHGFDRAFAQPAVRDAFEKSVQFLKKFLQ
ncbi:MAG: alpha/beta hydrolase [Bryobacterales bacterium]|nr:alpha/beta hydrolase [Bryobacterales bacterium]